MHDIWDRIKLQRLPAGYIKPVAQVSYTFQDSSRTVQVSHPRSLINQQWTMKTLLCVAVLALVASTIASPLPHRAAINNHHLLDNNVRELLQLLDNIQEEKMSVEKQEEEEVATLPPDDKHMLHEVVEGLDDEIIKFLDDIQKKVREWKNVSQLSDVADEIEKVKQLIELLEAVAKEEAMAQSPYPPPGRK